MDFQGLVPVYLVQSGLLTSASYPRLKLVELGKRTRDKKEADLTETVAKLRDELRGQGRLKEKMRGQETEIERLKQEVSQLRRRVKRRKGEGREEEEEEEDRDKDE